jgi:hypothetical protein
MNVLQLQVVIVLAQEYIHRLSVDRVLKLEMRSGLHIAKMFFRDGLSSRGILMLQVFHLEKKSLH